MPNFYYLYRLINKKNSRDEHHGCAKILFKISYHTHSGI